MLSTSRNVGKVRLVKFASRNETGEKGFTHGKRICELSWLTYVGRRFLGCCRREPYRILACGHGWSNFSLGHALNFLHYFDGRHVGNPEVVQPGVWYQLVCWAVLLISFGLFGREDIFTEVVTNPDSFG